MAYAVVPGGVAYPGPHPADRPDSWIHIMSTTAPAGLAALPHSVTVTCPEASDSPHTKAAAELLQRIASGEIPVTDAPRWRVFINTKSKVRRLFRPLMKLDEEQFAERYCSDLIEIAASNRNHDRLPVPPIPPGAGEAMQKAYELLVLARAAYVPDDWLHDLTDEEKCAIPDEMRTILNSIKTNNIYCNMLLQLCRTVVGLPEADLNAITTALEELCVGTPLGVATPVTAIPQSPRTPTGLTDEGDKPAVLPHQPGPAGDSSDSGEKTPPTAATSPSASKPVASVETAKNQSPPDGPFEEMPPEPPP